jgi:hypothetical protein
MQWTLGAALGEGHRLGGLSLPDMRVVGAEGSIASLLARPFPAFTAMAALLLMAAWLWRGGSRGSGGGTGRGGSFRAASAAYSLYAGKGRVGGDLDGGLPALARLKPGSLIPAGSHAMGDGGGGGGSGGGEGVELPARSSSGGGGTGYLAAFMRAIRVVSPRRKRGSPFAPGRASDGGEGGFANGTVAGGIGRGMSRSYSRRGNFSPDADS